MLHFLIALIQQQKESERKQEKKRRKNKGTQALQFYTENHGSNETVILQAALDSESKSLIPYNVSIVDDNSLTLEKLKSIFQKTIEAVAHCDKKLRQKFVEQKEEFANVFEVLLYSQTGLFQHEIDAVHAQFERLLLKIEIYFPDMDVKELKIKLSRFFHNYTEENKSLKITLKGMCLHLKFVPLPKIF